MAAARGDAYAENSWLFRLSLVVIASFAGTFSSVAGWIRLYSSLPDEPELDYFTSDAGT